MTFSDLIIVDAVTENAHHPCHNSSPASAMPSPSPSPHQRDAPTLPLEPTPTPVNACPPYVVLLVNVAAVEVAVAVLVEPASVPPIPLQIILPTFACREVVAVGVEVSPLVIVVFASEIVELPTTRKSLLGARLTGVSRIVTAEAPGVRVVPAMTIGSDGRITTGRL
jgi:hypothetical protein